MPLALSGVTATGQVTNIEGARSYRRDPVAGWITVFRYSGEEADMFAKANTFSPVWVLEGPIQEDAGVWTLMATFPGITTGDTGEPNENPQINWDLKYETAEKSLLDSSLGTVPFIPDFVCKAIKDAIKEQTETVLIQTLMRAQTAGSISVAGINAAALAYNHMLKGFEKVPVDVPVLYRSAIASNSWLVPWTDASPTRPLLLSTNTLIAQEDVAANLHLRLPTDVYTNPNGVNSVQLAYAWLVRPIDKSSSNTGRFVYTQSWKFGLWPTAYYGTVR